MAPVAASCPGRDQRGREGRVTGCGPAFGEFGGAGELVDKAIQAVSMAWARRGSAGQLAGAFSQLAGAAGVEDLLEGFALGRYHLSDSVAPVVFQAATQGDGVAQDTIRWAGRELGSLAVGVIRQLGFESLDFEAVLAGSLFDGGPLLTETLRAEIHAVAPGARLIHLKAPPVVGGVLLGMEQARIQTEPLRPVLAESVIDRLSRMGTDWPTGMRSTGFRRPGTLSEQNRVNAAHPILGAALGSLSYLRCLPAFRRQSIIRECLAPCRHAVPAILSTFQALSLPQRHGACPPWCTSV